MVTKALHPADPMARCPAALQAVEAELSALREERVWRESQPLPAKEAARLHPDAHFATLHSIVGVKNHESPDANDHIFKGRIVLGGHDVRDATGAAAIFSDIGNTPSTMAACRIAIACAAADPTLKLLQSDCKRAYTQAKMTGPPTFVRLPKKWWPKHFYGIDDPVCRLDQALYGHPKAGDIWGDRLEEVLVNERGFECVEGLPSVYFKS